MRDIMDYYDDMEILTDSPIKDQVLAHVAAFDENAYTAADVEAALQADYLTPSDFAALLSPAAEPFIPRMAKRAKYERDRYFGNSVFLFSPLYIANYCENRCVYCGFNAGMNIDRARLDDEEIEKELEEMGKMYGMELDDMKKALEGSMDYFRNDIRVKKTIDMLYDNAEITMVEPKNPIPAEEVEAPAEAEAEEKEEASEE